MKAKEATGTNWGCRCGYKVKEDFLIGNWRGERSGQRRKY